MRRPAHGGGLALAVLSAAGFGTSGAFAASLLEGGWSPATVVTGRVGLAALILTIPAVLALRGRWHLLGRNLRPIVLYGLMAVAACQFCFYNAVQHLTVGVALLLEYLGSVLVVAWLWARHGQRPRRLTIIGVATAVTGLALVLGVTGSVRLDAAGVGWGLGAAVGLAVYFVLSAHSDERLPPLVMAWGGMAVGALALVGAGLVGALGLQVGSPDVRFLDHRTSWIVPMAGLTLVAAVLAYVAGIAAARLLGARLATFVGLTEVVFAVLFAWILLAQFPTPGQLAGGVLILAGVAFVRLDELSGPDTDEPTGEPASELRAAWPEPRAGQPARG